MGGLFFGALCYFVVLGASADRLVLGDAAPNSDSNIVEVLSTTGYALVWPQLLSY